jgi:hypothetical protein
MGHRIKSGDAGMQINFVFAGLTREPMITGRGAVQPRDLRLGVVGLRGESNFISSWQGKLRSLGASNAFNHESHWLHVDEDND